MLAARGPRRRILPVAMGAVIAVPGMPISPCLLCRRYQKRGMQSPHLAVREPGKMSINDLVTAIIAVAAVAVPLAALLISRAVDKRSARSTLTDLAVKINEMATSYAKLQSETGSAKATEDYARTKGTDDLYMLCTEIEMLVGQADFLVFQLEPGRAIRWIPPVARRPHYAWSIPITLAQALESTDDPWWADRYWKMSVRTSNQHVRAWAFCYWTMALCNRGEYKPHVRR